MEAKHTPGPWLAICDDIEPPFVQYVDNREVHERNAQYATAGNVSFTYVPLTQAKAAPELLAENERLVAECAELRALVQRIQGALGTGEEGDNLVAVAQDAHNAEMELADRITKEREE